MLDRPELYPGQDLYLNAFYDLTHERLANDKPIPITRIMYYADSIKLYDGDKDLFITLVKRLDFAYLKYRRENPSNGNAT